MPRRARNSTREHNQVSHGVREKNGTGAGTPPRQQMLEAAILVESPAGAPPRLDEAGAFESRVPQKQIIIRENKR